MSTSQDTIVKEDKPIIIPKRRVDSLVDFFMMKTEEVMDKFATLPNAIKVGQGDQSFVYVPPTREKSVLLIAHADTVFRNEDVEVGYCDGTYMSMKKGVGLGADDRAGCAMLWKLRNLGHALLIPNAEESGCIGSKFLMQNEEWRKRLNTHLFAIEMDRMNASDLAFYRVGGGSCVDEGKANVRFQDWCEQQFKGYKYVYGMWTDICVLCDADKHKEDCLDGVNISVGYYGQHNDHEILKEREWQRTLSSLHTVLSQEDLPKFRHKYWEYTPPTYNHHTNFHGYNNSHGYPVCKKPYEKQDTKASTVAVEVLDSILVCPQADCGAMFDESEFRQNESKCPYCKEGF